MKILGESRLGEGTWEGGREGGREGGKELRRKGRREGGKERESVCVCVCVCGGGEGVFKERWNDKEESVGKEYVSRNNWAKNWRGMHYLTLSQQRA